MYLCYIDESGQPHIPKEKSSDRSNRDKQKDKIEHFVLACISIPISRWFDCVEQVRRIKSKYRLDDKEIHTANILMWYRNQDKIENFEDLTYNVRVHRVKELRNCKLRELRKTDNDKYKKKFRNFGKSDDYVHLSRKERRKFVKEIAMCIGTWDFASIFAECIDKKYFISQRIEPLENFAFKSVVKRLGIHLNKLNDPDRTQRHQGIIIHDNCDFSNTHTKFMKSFKPKWSKFQDIVETPLFVNSELTEMIQIADLCAYSLRRYFENSEKELFDTIINRSNVKNWTGSGFRHFAPYTCNCDICETRRKHDDSYLYSVK